MSGPQFLVFDYETLSNNPLGAPVISLGAIIGNWEDVSYENIKALEKDAFYCTIKAKRQADVYGLIPNKETIRWWSEQNEFAQNMLKSDSKIEVEEHCKQFIDWCISKGLTQKTMTYIRAPQFDYTIMANVFAKCGFPIPFNEWKVRDVRSIIDATFGTENGYVPNFRETLEDHGLIEHFAVHDVIKDLLQLKLCRDVFED